ncbi:hypothetical protein BOTBODRAFT_27077 [Botryobasidium botryosum FD-172 SS1]|uniref:Vacuolar ATPase assembly integral membrane protein VMA21 n=1 Tax=Botryobasidium botryosum (strain FD-172 SS1) TaxID=930990 RepID=A0A067NBB2_BOTB1|nr:hypothetical protein BOTBODRAFT_27077 [Botryobasidium botryosum FD-172 SS1]
MATNVAASHVMNRTADGSILTKLLTFSIALAIAPIGSYFISIWYIFKGNSVYAALIAIVASNLVLAAFIFASVLEDNDARKNHQAVVNEFESKKMK